MVGWPAVRTFHMSGGLRVIEIGEGETVVEPVFGEFKFEAESYSRVSRSIKREVGLDIRACEVFRSDDEIKGLCQPDWHPVMPLSSSDWPSKTAEIDWSGLANAAEEAGALPLAKIAASIQIQSRYAAFSILTASDYYHKNLTAILTTNGSRSDFSNKWLYGYFVDNAYSAIHGCFLALATLRDYLATYIAYVALGKPKIDSMKDLLVALRKGECAHPVAAYLVDSSQNGEWLQEFTSLRNTFAHRSPFGHGSGSPAVAIKGHVTPTGRLLHMLHVPLPKLEGRTLERPPSFDDATAVRTHYDALLDRPDTLDYIYASMSRLMGISRMIRDTFPYEPKMFTLTDKDIISITLSRGE